VPTPSAFAKRVAAVALDQHQQFHMRHEHDPPLAKQIQRFWGDLGFAFPGVHVAWSAVFVSWCLQKAGATPDDFLFERAHGRFVHWAIRNAEREEGLFHGLPITEHPPGVGDIIQNNRSGHRFDFAFARTHSKYESHSAIVVETGQDPSGLYLLTVGGNEGNSVGMKEVRLTNSGFVKQRENSAFISVIRNMKP
jgi:hypothetical protein